MKNTSIRPPEVTFQPDFLVSLGLDYFFSSLGSWGYPNKPLMCFLRNNIINFKIIVLEVYCQIKYGLSPWFNWLGFQWLDFDNI